MESRIRPECIDDQGSHQSLARRSKSESQLIIKLAEVSIGYPLTPLVPEDCEQGFAKYCMQFP